MIPNRQALPKELLAGLVVALGFIPSHRLLDRGRGVRRCVLCWLRIAFLISGSPAGREGQHGVGLHGPVWLVAWAG